MNIRGVSRPNARRRRLTAFPLLELANEQAEVVAARGDVGVSAIEAREEVIKRSLILDGADSIVAPLGLGFELHVADWVPDLFLVKAALTNKHPAEVNHGLRRVGSGFEVTLSRSAPGFAGSRRLKLTGSGSETVASACNSFFFLGNSFGLAGNRFVLTGSILAEQIKSHSWFVGSGSAAWRGRVLRRMSNRVLLLFSLFLFCYLLCYS